MSYYPAEKVQNSLTRLERELRLVSTGRGFQPAAPCLWQLSPGYFPLSLPLLGWFDYP